MTPQEFKAWFEGFSEGIADRPTVKQWQRICKRVKEVDGTPINYPVYINRYVKPYCPRPWEILYKSGNSLSQLPQNASGDAFKIGRDAMRGLLQDIGRAEVTS